METEAFLKYRLLANTETLFLSFVASFYVGKRLREITWLKDRLEYLAGHDYLTGLSNRFALYDFLSKSGGTLGLILIDIDNFKSANDLCGHTAGDLLLQSFAEMLREYDIPQGKIVRFSGDEFMIILPQADLKEVVAFAEGVRKNIKQMQVVIHEKELEITASFGVTLLQGPANKAAADDAISRADEALYHAKKNGRNQVCATHESV